MNWYLAKLIFDVQNDAASGTPQVAGQWRLIRADEIDWAHEKALLLGRLEASGRLSQTEATSPGRFIGVTDMIHIGAYNDGETIPSLTEEPAHPKFFKHTINSSMDKSLLQGGYATPVKKIAAR